MGVVSQSSVEPSLKASWRSHTFCFWFDCILLGLNVAGVCANLVRGWYIFAGFNLVAVLAMVHALIVILPSWKNAIKQRERIRALCVVCRERPGDVHRALATAHDLDGAQIGEGTAHLRVCQECWVPGAELILEDLEGIRERVTVRKRRWRRRTRPLATKKAPGFSRGVHYRIPGDAGRLGNRDPHRTLEALETAGGAGVHRTNPRARSRDRAEEDAELLL